MSRSALQPEHPPKVTDLLIKAHLQRRRVQVEAFLAHHLRLKTNSKTQVFPVALVRGRALDFLGYRIWPTHRRLRKSSISRITRTLKRLRRHYAEGRVTRARVLQSIASWVAHALHADAAGLKRHILGKFKFRRAERRDPEEGL